MNRRWLIVKWTLRNTLQWNSKQNTKLVIGENAFGYVVCKWWPYFIGLNVLNIYHSSPQYLYCRLCTLRKAVAVNMDIPDCVRFDLRMHIRRISNNVTSRQCLFTEHQYETRTHIDCFRFIMSQSTRHNGCRLSVGVDMNNTLQWPHKGRDGVSNHQPHDCLFERRSKKASKLRVTGLCAGIHRGPVNSPHKGPVTRKMFLFDDGITIS